MDKAARNFEVDGLGRESGRRRHRIYKAADEGAARMMAFKDGTVIETIHELPPDPPEPATDKQKIYAAALAIDFSPGISKDRISELIDAHFDKNEDVVGILQHLSDAHRTARITYWKFGEAAASTRVVEPYELVDGENGSQYFQCWQLSPPPDDGDHWRTFRTDRIKSARDGGGSFSARKTLSIGAIRLGIAHHGRSGKSVQEPYVSSWADGNAPVASSYEQRADTTEHQAYARRIKSKRLSPVVWIVLVVCIVLIIIASRY